ncbi:uncharacterized protein EV422DRAFT_565164 [Fimicolochytrium jonesii]|uniref:uncharacterized protein n=1 Tax=Fimicolochytrium jonesii TaxID=1396493 RepID=UPI0022FEBA12|nr:uncharacterized protein EV422DRAFT_565164 [Fimicolochytrium jonesii]KAI8824475.1 hypothetical protein EV422DRAFT_565164 [Fimicolochytrium jonesii]
MAIIVTALVALLAIVGGALFPAGRTFYRLQQENRGLQYTADSSCKLVQDPLLRGCENGALHAASGQVFFACAVDLETRSKWFPPAHLLDREAAKEPKGAIVVLDLKTTKARKLDLHNFTPSFHTFGIGIAPSRSDPKSIIISAVNVGLDGNSIETFTHKIGDKHATHVNTFRDEKLLHSPNDVVPIDEDSFYATNDRSKAAVGSLAWGIVGNLGWSKAATVVYKGKDGKARVVADKFTLANGITTSADQKHVYVVDTMAAIVNVYERRHNNGLRLRDTIEVPVLGDNVAVDGSTGAIYVSGVIDIMGCLKDIPMKSPCLSGVVKVTNNTGSDQLYGKKFNADVVHTEFDRVVPAGIAAVDHHLKKSFVAGWHGGVVVCDKVF